MIRQMWEIISGWVGALVVLLLPVVTPVQAQPHQYPVEEPSQDASSQDACSQMPPQGNPPMTPTQRAPHQAQSHHHPQHAPPQAPSQPPQVPPQAPPQQVQPQHHPQHVPPQAPLQPMQVQPQTLQQEITAQAQPQPQQVPPQAPPQPPQILLQTPPQQVQPQHQSQAPPQQFQHLHQPQQVPPNAPSHPQQVPLHAPPQPPQVPPQTPPQQVQSQQLAAPHTVLQGQNLTAYQLPCQHQPLLRPDDHFILRFYVALMRVVQPVLVHVVQLLTNNTNNPKMLLFSLPGYSNTQYKRDFNQLERQRLDNNTPINTHDISLLFKLLQTVCGLAGRNDDKWTTPRTLENNLRQLKDQRNDFAHEELTLTLQTLRVRLSLLEELCRTILVVVGLRIRHYVVNYVIDMERDMEEILTGAIDLWEPYKEGLKQLQLKQRSVLIREGRKEIRELAQKLRILNPFVWLLEDKFDHMDVGNIYTEVNIDREGPMKTQDIFKPHITSGEFPDVIIFTGSPGIGKTSLIRFLLSDWATEKFSVNGIYNFDLVLPVELRYVTCSSVQELLGEDILPQSCHHLYPSDVIPTLQELSILWLVDGFDEATGTTQTLVKGLLKKFSNSKFIITTRTDCLKDLELLISGLRLSHITCQIRGFSPDQWVSYAEKLFSVSVKSEIKRQSSCTTFLDFMQDHKGQMKYIFSVPLFVAMLVMLWLEDPSIVTASSTITKLYHTLLDLTISRMTRRLEFILLGFTDRQLRNKISQLLHLLGEILWENSLNPTFILLEHQIRKVEDFCETLGLPFRESLSSFCMVVVKKTLTGTIEEYRPLHRTMQEFLAARAFSKTMIMQDCDVLTLGAQWKVKHLRNKDNSTSNLPSDLTNRLDLQKQETFAIKKLHEGSDMMFDDFEFSSSDIFPVKCYCRYKYVYKCGYPVEECERNCFIYFQPFSYQSLLFKFICGYLKIQNELTKERVQQIIYLVTWGRDTNRKYSLWLKLIQETEEDPVLLEELNSQISSYQWNPRPSELSLVGKLLQYVSPEALLIHICDLDKYNEGEFTNALRQYSKYSLEISLDLRNSSLDKIWSDIAQVSLSVLLNDEASCYLTSLGCHLNTHSVELLHRACYLQDLYVTVDCLQDLQRLAEAVNSFSSLSNLSIFLNFNWTQVPVKMFPTFNVSPCVKRNTVFFEDYMASGIFVAGILCNTDYRRVKTIVTLQTFGKPLVKSHKLLYRLRKNCKHKKERSFNKPRVAIIPYPIHLESLRRSEIALDIMKVWNMPSAHCHDHCSDVWSDPVLCHDACGHKINRPPGKFPPRLISVVQTKPEWLHHQKAIKYHRTSLRKLRPFYSRLWKEILTKFRLAKTAFKRVYDPHIKMRRSEFCSDHPLSGSVWDICEALLVCELCIYEHRISIQSHQNFLCNTRQPQREYCSPVRLSFTDTFLTSPQNFSAVVRQLCPSPLAVYMLGRMTNSSCALDFVQYIWYLGQAVPTVQRVTMNITESQPPRWQCYTQVDYGIRNLTYKSAPKFRFSLSWTATTNKIGINGIVKIGSPLRHQCKLHSKFYSC